MRGRRHLGLIVPIALLVGACGGDADTSSSGSGSSSTIVGAATVDDADRDESADTGTSPATSTSATTTPDATATTVAPDPAECLPGTWELRAQDFFDQIVATAGGGGDMRHLGGRHLAIFEPDGTAEGRREAWSFEVAASEGSLVTTVDATNTGTWAVEGDTITVSSQEQTFQATFEIVVGGVRQPLPVAPPNSVDTDAFGGEGPYTCEGDVLTITLTDADVTITNTWDRVAG